MKRYLGYCELPFSTVYHSARSTWEGTLKFIVPRVSLAYAHHGDMAPDQDANTPPDRHSTLSLYITLTPGRAQRTAQDSFDPSHSNEPLGLFWHAQRWPVRCRDDLDGVVAGGSPHLRLDRIIAMVLSTDKRATLISRYIHSEGLAPPQELMADAEIPPEYVLSRFVSIIPYMENVAVDDDTGTCWNTSLEFLETGAGDYDEHCILLANYFQWLTHPPYRRFSSVWVVLGSTNSHLKASYVLTVDAVNPDGIFLWDPVTGDKYTLFSHRCPLRDIGVVFNHTNIFCNTQPSSQPRRMDWNLFGNPRSWRPLFLDVNSIPKESCQPPINICYPVAEEKEMRIRILLVEEIKAQLKRRRCGYGYCWWRRSRHS
eukprot:TRINITY_DN15817_c0_g1_i1.p1 TRINITY_DN15817_c0_g1~~TRINITY_DN15817_c0_g1_i1.p1  ORF type:complete len:371 (+),score=96.61 TRINITY_DN15817_c0_g1_i1:81-1193(+)